MAGFNRLRQEQRGLASKAAELEMELNEHKYVTGRVFERVILAVLGECSSVFAFVNHGMN